MKIVVVHNFYGSTAPSGENTVVEAEIALLQAAGHEVIRFFRHSDAVRDGGIAGLTRTALAVPWNPVARRRLRRLLLERRPDIVHVHNTFPLHSPSVFSAAAGLETAVVFTIHNFRLFCSNGLALRQNAPCMRCLDARSVWPAVRFGCYRASRLATIPVALMIALNRRLATWTRHVDAFISLSPFQRDLMLAYGIPANRLWLKPNSHTPATPALAWSARDDKVVFVGRLSPEKGVHVLVEAWARWGNDAPVLEIIGEGPERPSLERAAAASPARSQIRFLGRLPASDTQAHLARARLAVVPSLCFEAFPLVAQEAFALGVPIVASRLGSLADIVADNETGRLFPPGDAGALLEAAQSLWRTPSELERSAEAATMQFRQRYTAAKGYEELMAIYRAAIATRAASRAVPVGLWPRRRSAVIGRGHTADRKRRDSSVPGI